VTVTRLRRAPRVVQLGLLLAVVAVTWSANGPAAAASGGTISGVVLGTAACPVVVAERPCPTQPVVGARISFLRNGTVVARTTSGQTGGFRVAARPGEVVVRARMSFGGYVARAARTLVVHASTTSRVRLVLDNGVR
jgi:hypothetical protein